ncbi:conserved hypothetical protein [Neospora caninum Liverpool]|uniref:UNC-50 family protein n=1 Tax=Neospora caninum (strain Liverpool) TaxID=572307 RepID=F0VH84_NEOCL|nr:conserved hypothetical protein [Neospora caninum Liverpool]CBZ53078.1 conserved hypothetical protein [Neospora caninum Liverpool]CEL67062.1 TPA: hypothetical protein BN1204_028670 [Neospora caninum Liverpool]|eukprot:XP_003883110.1 conserved hypothetical protein [Neospora caninum Liverpool]
MLPTYHRGGCPCFPSLIPPATLTSFLSNFCHRVAHLSLMDLQFSLAQFYLLLFSPRKVYEFASIRKKQKNYYARDDPGFLLLLFFFFLVTGVVYALAFSQSALGFLFTSLAPPVYLLLSSFVLPLLNYFILLNRPRHSHSRTGTISSRSREGRNLSPSSTSGPRPEFLFCFDVHWNASFLYLVFGLILYLLLFPILRLLPLTVELFFSNAIQVVGLTAYCYVTALGYARLGFSDSSLPFFLPALVFLLFAIVATASSVNLGDLLISALLYSQNQLTGPTMQKAGVPEATVIGLNDTIATPPAAPEVSVHLEASGGK